MRGKGGGGTAGHIRAGFPGQSIKAQGSAIICERHGDGPARWEINDVPTAVITPASDDVFIGSLSSGGMRYRLSRSIRCQQHRRAAFLSESSHSALTGDRGSFSPLLWPGS